MTASERNASVISLDRVTKTFDKRIVGLRDVTFTVPPGEFCVLLGSSGAGKSTLLRHISGLHKPTSGKVSVLGTDVETARERTLRSLRRHIGFIFQQFNLVGQLSVLENVCSGALGRLRGPRLGLLAYSSRLRREALQHLDRVGLPDQAFQRADTLSGGQQQRVAIARALMQRPAILLADEPVASLDPDSAKMVMGLLQDIVREQRMTLVSSLHQLDLALSCADRIIGLQRGAIVLDTPACLMNADTVMEVYNNGSPEPMTLQAPTRLGSPG
ncbi:phosphonate ABC transporter ATP-binding protein [Spongiactinospora gelatinilytica]|uniref:Phosphonate ABC transporter ATP-binding protein n=1 Tax=Spongiactinospora gelatinilytica TaxID=2666298 RepID=A0A2W2HYX9_9ACTN|nr:phosphonate ABC transporter ATP-binding protein [Spongiactinospora gelatinilytica]PZG56675.1 phosphonate ABC transporter ATP-binding protein [Spongiactinospora gelatinilytica]